MNLFRKMEEANLAADMVLRDNAPKEATTAAYYVKNYFEYVKLWSKYGGKTFILSRDLIEAFSHTDISFDMLPSDFKYPFDSFLIEGDVPLFTTNSFESMGNDIRPVEAILYTSAKALMTINLPIVDLNGVSHDKLDWDHALNGFFPAVIGASNIMLYMRNDATIRSAADLKKEGAGMVTVTNNDSQKLCNIFFNTLLYINDPTRIIAETQSTGSRKLKRSGGGTARSEYIYLRPPKSYRPLYSSSGRTLDVRFIVRGHWRNQAVGVGRKDHKLIWIKPHWKGPEMSEVVSKKYVVD